MSDCVNCKCDTLTPSNENCTTLQSENDKKIKEFAIYYRDLQTCQLADEGAKGFFNVWCMFKNVIGQVCWLASQIKPQKSIKAGDNINIVEDDSSYTISAKSTDTSGFLTKDEAKATYQIKLKAGNNITLNDDGTISAVVKETDLSNYAKKSDIKTYSAGDNITIDSGGKISATIPAPKDVDLSGYVTKSEYNKVKDTLDKIINNLKASGAWSGDDFVNGRSIATGNINVFGQDEGSFIRTNNGSTENDLLGGI